MKDMGFKQLFKDEENPNGYLLTSFLYPENPLFIFEEFYNRLADAGLSKYKFALTWNRAQNKKNTFALQSDLKLFQLLIASVDIALIAVTDNLNLTSVLSPRTKLRAQVFSSRFSSLKHAYLCKSRNQKRSSKSS